MRTLNRILLVSDRSASADAAALYAAALARQTQASLTALRVVETGIRALPRWTDMFRASEAMAEQEAEGRAALDALASHPAFDGLEAEYVLDHGRPADRIIDRALDADLVVIGMGDADTAVGRAAQRTASEVAHGSPAPVLLTPPEGGAAGVPAPQASAPTWRRLLLAIDLAGYAPQALDMATSLAASQQASLLALQVVDPQRPASYPVQAGEGMHHNTQGLRALLNKRLAEALPDVSDGPPYLRQVLEGDAAEVIIAQIAAHQADLVIVSAHPYGAIQRLFTPSTVDAILATGACPVLAAPFPRSVFA